MVNLQQLMHQTF